MEGTTNIFIFLIFFFTMYFYYFFKIQNYLGEVRLRSSWSNCRGVPGGGGRFIPGYQERGYRTLWHGYAVPNRTYPGISQQRRWVCLETVLNLSPLSSHSRNLTETSSSWPSKSNDSCMYNVCIYKLYVHVPIIYICTAFKYVNCKKF